MLRNNLQLVCKLQTMVIRYLQLNWPTPHDEKPKQLLMLSSNLLMSFILLANMTLFQVVAYVFNQTL